jgi:hypothetical protein
VLGAVPIVGNTNLALTVGDSLASYQDSDARSSSETVDLGGLGVILANTNFCGSLVLPASEQPQPLSDDSDGGPPADTNNLDGAGTEAVTADASPESASATTTPVGQDVAGLITVGGQSFSAVSYIAGDEREAQSTAQAQLTIDKGLVSLRGMSWTAEQSTGRSWPPPSRWPTRF